MFEKSIDNVDTMWYNVGTEQGNGSKKKERGKRNEIY